MNMLQLQNIIFKMVKSMWLLERFGKEHERDDTKRIFKVEDISR